MTNQKLLLPLVIFTGLACGWFLGSGRAGEQDATAKPAPTAPSSKRALAIELPETTPPHNFAAYKERVAHPFVEEEATAAVERMSSQELRAILLDAPLFEWRDTDPEKYLRKIATKAAAKELVRREAIAAVDWAESTERKETMLHVLAAFSALDPAAAQPRVREFNRRFNDPSTGLGFTFSAAARDAAALRGAEELLEAQQIFDSYDAGSIYELAPDFDFATYFAKCPKPREAEALMKSWAAADPDAAFKAVAARFKTASPDDSLIGQAVSGCATLHGEPEAAKRASALLADLSPEHREYALRSFTRDVSPSRAAAIVKALPNETDRTTFIQQVMAIGHRADGDATLAAFQALETEELQVRTLVEIVKSTSPQVRENPNSWTYQTKRIEGLMEKLGISEAGRERWRATLPQ